MDKINGVSTNTCLYMIVMEKKGGDVLLKTVCLKYTKVVSPGGEMTNGYHHSILCGLTFCTVYMKSVKPLFLSTTKMVIMVQV